MSVESMGSWREITPAIAVTSEVNDSGLEGTFYGVPLIEPRPLSQAVIDGRSLIPPQELPQTTEPIPEATLRSRDFQANLGRLFKDHAS